MLELAILGLLKERPMHGYQLSRELTEQLGGLWKVSYGSLYPTLKRLEREGAVEQVPGTSAGTGRKRLVYRITAPGEQLFLKLLEEPPSDTQAEEAADDGDDYQRALMEHGRAASEADIAWLAGLIQQERTKYGITAPVGQRRRASATLRRKERTA